MCGYVLMVNGDMTTALNGFVSVVDREMMMMMMMMMSGFIERVINSPQTRYRSAKQVVLQMSSERQRGESCGSQSGW